MVDRRDNRRAVPDQSRQPVRRRGRLRQSLFRDHPEAPRERRTQSAFRDLQRLCRRFEGAARLAWLAASHVRGAADHGPAAAPVVGEGLPAEPYRHRVGLAAKGLDRPRRRAATRLWRLPAVDAGLVRPPFRRRLLGAAAVAAFLGIGALGLVQAQQPTPRTVPDEASGPPQEEAPVPIEVTPNAPQAQTTEEARAPGARPEPVAAVTMAGKPVGEPSTAPPHGAPKPIRSPTAVIQALDKVTAETMRLAAPIGRQGRYQKPIFNVQACQNTGL